MAVTLAEPAAAFSATGAFQAVVSTAPTISSSSPTVGETEGGTAVVLLGTGFKKVDTTDLESVLFGVIPATRIEVVSDTKMIAVSPPGTGTVVITVKTSGGTSRSAPKFGYRMLLTATFDSVAAKAIGGTEIPVEVGGGSVGVSATAFASMKITATVGGLAAKVKWVDETHVKVVTPVSMKTGPAVIQFNHDGYAGTPSTSVVNVFPWVSSTAPTAANVVGGDTIKIAGAGFLSVDETNADAVTIGGVPATSFEVTSGTLITAVVPATSTIGTAVVKVTTPDASSADDGPLLSYRGPLAVDIADDQFLRAGGGTHVLAVTGGSLGDSTKDFAAAQITLLLGKTKLTPTYVDATHLRVTVPASNAESAEVRLLQGVVPGPAVTVPIAPVVTALSLIASPITGGKSIQVKVAGLGAATATDFTFGSNAATCQKGSASATVTYVCTVPSATDAGPVQVRFTSGSGAASRYSAAATFSYTDLD
ncbi:IPT/TIG domain-containing protein [Actinoplanes awajinensis]|uniref:IPT/TIG domain-containing protein n=1 Tax=Actinoplanes awajinensis TaxID=135946 RepID=UPI0018DDFCC9|nr:IPT/TIG domain-containing protein [Actinoplanes awajinensis]